LSWDLLAGVVLGIAAGVLSWQQPVLTDGSRGTLYAIMALGLALSGLVLGALTLMVTLMSDEYRAILEATGRGVRGAWTPYVIVAGVGATSAGFALVAATAWRLMNEVWRAVALGASTGLAVWGLVGFVELVLITRWHGEQRAALLRQMHDARRLLDERKARRDRTA